METLARLTEEGLAMFVAAGNSGDQASLYSPASERTACTVGAIGEDDVRASFSNYGPELAVFAPGVNILSNDFAMLMGSFSRLEKHCTLATVSRDAGFSYDARIDEHCELQEKHLNGDCHARKSLRFQQSILDLRIPVVQLKRRLAHHQWDHDRKIRLLSRVDTERDNYARDRCHLPST